MDDLIIPEYYDLREYHVLLLYYNVKVLIQVDPTYVVLIHVLVDEKDFILISRGLYEMTHVFPLLKGGNFAWHIQIPIQIV